MRVPELRVIDFGRVSPLRSQTLWHAIASGVSAGAPPTLSFLRSADPYVCIGYHRGLDEVDLVACRRRKLPVYRRMVGGGPVYVDDGQLLFQITVPAASVSPMRVVALRELLAPAVTAFRAAGADAVLDAAGEIVVGDRKVCGHGAGQIDGAVVVVGNLIERFDHAAASAVLRAPSADARREVQRLMERYVAPTPLDAETFQRAAIEAYARTLGCTPAPGALTAAEEARVEEFDDRFRSPSWTSGPCRAAPEVWQAKIRAGVSVMATTNGPTTVVASLVGGRIERVEIADPALNGSAAALGDALAGCRLGDADSILASWGEAGHRVGAALAGAREVA